MDLTCFLLNENTLNTLFLIRQIKQLELKLELILNFNFIYFTRYAGKVNKVKSIVFYLLQYEYILSLFFNNIKVII